MTPNRERLAELARRSVFHKGKFRNLERTPSHGLKDFFRWQMQSGPTFPPGKRFPLLKPDVHVLSAPAVIPRLTWLGHSSFLFQYRHCNVLTDPVFSERCSPVQFAGPKRYTPAPLSVAELPDITHVLISHNHYDHLDEKTVLELDRRFSGRLTFYVPTGVADWFRRRDIHSVVEIGWWQSSVDATASAEVFCLPAQHFSGRGPTDRNASLWCSWLMEIAGFRLYFAGDTGYASLFADIGDVFDGIDLALLPIGAYDPRWFMAPVHVAPDEAVRIHRDIRAKVSVAMHWGTFVLTSEPMDEPPRRLRQAMAEAGVKDNEFRVLQHGETVDFTELLKQ
ncbi:MAG: phospholipase [Gammaproteobacteria bacterium HGW-Gammaproteobacteria-14]|nr:MAG: phospholipase [Gammaproteobacteria bacterium HGW-Gammaproteobacteria-14]